MKDVGSRLRRARRRAGQTASEVARKMDICPSTQMRRESGADFRIDELVRYGRLLGVSVEWLAFGRGKP